MSPVGDEILSKLALLTTFAATQKLISDDITDIAFDVHSVETALTLQNTSALVVVDCVLSRMYFSVVLNYATPTQHSLGSF